MPAILKIKDENGKIYQIPAIRGEKGNAIETGTYTGTGEFGPGAPTQLNLPFKAKLLCISEENPTGELLFWMEGLASFLCLGSETNTAVKINVSENLVTFYHTENAAKQYNASETKYRYIAFG